MLDLAPFIKENILIHLAGEINIPTSLAINSQAVERGGAFVAIPGSQHDGTAYIDDALNRGASVIVVSQEVGEKVASYFQEKYPHVSFLAAHDIRKVASLLASCFYPLQPETIVAVTGTNGKTSVVSFIRQIWHHLRIPGASLGTLGLIVEGRPLPPPSGTEGLNTPNPVKFHQILQSLKEQDIDHLAFEASSHGLHQHRLDAVRLKVAVFTNFTNDHLDYHHTMEAYFEAKCRLFQEIMLNDTHAILNTDIPEYEKLQELCNKRNLKSITFGKLGEMIRLISIIPKRDSQDVMLSVNGKMYNFNLPLAGQFQVYNVMAALGAVLACGANASQAIDACVNLKGVPGRLQQAAPGIFVDYAHTPDALSVALKSLRPHSKGRLCVVFGCGGNRDAIKRPMMGEIAANLADKVIVTDDNPRHEDPSKIREQILATCPGAIEIPSRRQAIAQAIEGMEPLDVVLIAGKGHETYQLVGDQVLPFNDVEEVRRRVKI